VSAVIFLLKIVCLIVLGVFDNYTNSEVMNLWWYENVWRYKHYC